MNDTPPLTQAEHLAESSRRKPYLRFGVGASILLVLTALVVAVLVTALSPSGESTSIGAIESRGAEITGPAASGLDDSASEGLAEVSADPGSPGAPGQTAQAPAVIFVHVLGAVKTPGLYELRSGDRVVDVVAAAGGLLATADPSGVNLARYLSDGEQLYVPTVGETPPPRLGSGTPGSGAVAGGAAAGGSGGSAGFGHPVNLNTASQAELETLPRVGPMMAQRIIEWRQAHGRFTSIDDLLSITGIGPKTLETLRDLVVL